METSMPKNDFASYDDLLPIIYDQLRAIAHQKLAYERQGHTLNTTALVHEAYYNLAKQHKLQIENKEHFMALAAQAMRRVLVNYARDRQAQKRSHDRVAITQATWQQPITITPDEILALHDALENLNILHERQAKIIELWFFGGYQHEEIANLLQVSLPTIRRDWRMARAWLSKTVKQVLA
ncbi:MAG: sigma-70 family RNA polymerase sigma factor [Saprospiraceae bacterium]|nr:sigma-70 family RNA polymerase sigma factor [Saprospiraceae bacterium]